jgi:small ligand-binding sensory domain FIST
MTRLSVGAGLSRDPDAGVAVRAAVEQALAQAGLQRADWALCFFTAPHLSQADTIRRTVLDRTGCAALGGCSAMGVLSGEAEIEREPGIAVMVGAGAVDAHSAILPQSGDGLAHFRDLARAAGMSGAGEDESDDDSARGSAASGSATRGGALVMLPDTYQVDPALLRDKMAADAEGVPLLGAGATDDGTVGISLQIGMEGVRSGSVSALGLFGPLRLEIGITQSCCAVGDPHFITQAKEHVLMELDGRPALHAFIDQGRALGIETMQQAANELMFGFPLDSEHPEFVGEACLVRSLAGFDQATHGLVVPHPLQPQGAMGFMHRSRATAERDLLRMVDGVADKLGGAPDFGLYFDCSARGRGLYGRPGVDVEAIRRRLGDFPLIGMFGGFELATALGTPQVYTYTGVLALFRQAN